MTTIFGLNTPFRTSVAALVVSLFAILPMDTSAQSIPFCLISDPNPDPDNNGFGFEDNAQCQLPIPTAINRETGLPIQLERSYWLPEDTNGVRDVECSDFVFSAETSTYEFIIDVFLIFNPPRLPNCEGQTCGGEGTVNVLGNVGPYSTENGVLSLHTGFTFGLWKEVGFQGDPNTTTNVPAFRQWNIDGGGYTECTGIASSGVVPQLASSSNCVDTSPVGDGWGWNGASSCQIATNAICIDTDPVGDGWGWDGSSSCRIETVLSDNCDDPDGDGWGWNGTTSCRTDTTNTGEDDNACVDSDGDGWGWDGTASCRTDTTNAGDGSNECIDSDGDGWGWNGVSSCRI